MSQTPPVIQATWITDRTLACDRRFCVHQGGTRSGKTYNLSIAFAVEWERRKDWILSVVRKTGPALKATVVRDLIEVLDAMGLYDPSYHNKSEQVIVNPRSGSVIEYFSCDQPQKVRGRKRNLLWMNEANELTAEDFRQLNLRTTDRVWMDFNPSMQEHWIWDLFEGDTDYREQSEWHMSTYLDNPFLSSETVRQIEALRDTDPYAWEVYGLGRRGASPASIYPATYESRGIDPNRESVLGLDFGYNDPMVLVRCQRIDREGAPELHIDELVHESHLTTDDLIARLPGLGVTKSDRIYCDGAEPDRIEMLQRAGYDAVAADKSRGSVRAGIDFLKQHRLCFTPRSVRSRTEFRGYRWRTRPDESIMDEPSGVADHAPDAVRYACYSHWNQPVLDYSRI